jgi:hypothetical protein
VFWVIKSSAYQGGRCKGDRIRMRIIRVAYQRDVLLAAVKKSKK